MCINISELERNVDIDANDTTGDLLANTKTQKRSQCEWAFGCKSTREPQKANFAEFRFLLIFH